jgi:hypothetical protein
MLFKLRVVSKFLFQIPSVSRLNVYPFPVLQVLFFRELFLTDFSVSPGLSRSDLGGEMRSHPQHIFTLREHQISSGPLQV